MEQALAFAQQMSEAKLLPAHLQKSPADCLRVVLQSVRWQMDPFAVADKTSIIQNKLMYEGQLVSAVVNARGNLSKRLSYEYNGEGDARVLTVSGTVRGESEPRVIELPFSLAKKINRNGQMNTNPDQQAAYIGARIWARRHMPELMLGVYTPDEMGDDEQGSSESAPETAVRPAPKPRSPKGAAAIKTAEPVGTPQTVPAVVVTPEPAPAATPAPTPEPTAPAKGAVAAEVSPVEHARRVEVAASAPRAFLKESEILECEVEVKSATARVSTLTGPGGEKTQAGITDATVKGGFSGVITDFNGAQLAEDGKTATPLPKYAAGTKLKVKIEGRKRKSDGLMQNRVLEVAVVEAAVGEEF